MCISSPRNSTSSDLDINAILNYRKDVGERGSTFIREPTPAEAPLKQHSDAHQQISQVPTTVCNARGKQHKLDVNAFELVEHHTSMSPGSFLQDDTVRAVYYKEVAEAMKRATGAAYVQVFHHQVRSEARAQGPPGGSSQVQGYAQGIHSDSSPFHAESVFLQSVDAASAKAGIDLSKGRFLYLNGWRNITDTPIADNALAVCDETSLVAPDDYALTDLYSEGYKLQQYVLNDRNSSSHRWFYFPQMTKDELLLFKQWDSDSSLTGRCGFHTSFKDPNSASDAPSRESIEVRALCYFPEHIPNTCPTPTVQGAIEPTVEVAVQKVVETMAYVLHFPAAARGWLVLTSKLGKWGIRQIAQKFAEDETGHLGLKGMSDERRAKVVDALLEESSGFELAVKRAVEQVKRSNASSSGGSSWTRWSMLVAVGAIGFGLGCWVSQAL